MDAGLSIPRLKPCLSDRDGYADWDRYEQLGLPDAWTNLCKKFPGVWIAPDEYFWTPNGFFQEWEGMTPDLLKAIRRSTGGCFYALSLQQQCAILGASYSQVDVSGLSDDQVPPTRIGKRGGKPIEVFALECYEKQGWKGDRREGAAFYFISYAVQELVESKGITFFPSNLRSDGSLIGRESLNEQESAALNYAVNELDDAFFRRSYSRWRRDTFLAYVTKTTPAEFSVEQVIGCYRVLGRQATYNLCERNMLGFTGMGWPDLTLYRENILRLVEVKSNSDKLTHRQAYWFRNCAIPLRWSVEVLHVNREK